MKDAGMKDAANAIPGVGAVDDALLQALMGVALAAGRAGLGLRPLGAAGAPATVEPRPYDAAKARAVLLRALTEIAPRTPLVFEGSPTLDRDPGPEFFLIDPADGADDDADPSGAETAVAIALIQDGAPVAGVVYAPLRERLWAARPGAALCADAPAEIGVDASRPISVRPATERVTAVTGRAGRPAGLDAFLAAYRAEEIRSSGAALKLCLIAEGSADLAPELSGSTAWSTAAGDAILRAAGGRTLTLDGEPLTYGAAAADHDRFANPPFVALGSVSLKTPVEA